MVGAIISPLKYYWSLCRSPCFCHLSLLHLFSRGIVSSLNVLQSSKGEHDFITCLLLPFRILMVPHILFSPFLLNSVIQSCGPMLQLCGRVPQPCGPMLQLCEPMLQASEPVLKPCGCVLQPREPVLQPCSMCSSHVCMPSSVYSCHVDVCSSYVGLCFCHVGLCSSILPACPPASYLAHAFEKVLFLPLCLLF